MNDDEDFETEEELLEEEQEQEEENNSSSDNWDQLRQYREIRRRQNATNQQQNNKFNSNSKTQSDATGGETAPRGTNRPFGRSGSSQVPETVKSPSETLPKPNGLTKPGGNIGNPLSKIGSKAGEAGKQTAKAAAEAGKAVGKAVGKAALTVLKFLLSNPIVLIIVIVLLIVLLIAILFFGGKGDGSTDGYFDSACNFNETMVTLASCSTSTTSNLTLKDYVIGATYSYMGQLDVNEEKIKTLMIILKTNALSKGNYNSSNKNISIDDCDTTYTAYGDIDSEKYQKYMDYYDEIANYLFVSESYNGSISSLNAANSLTFNDDIFNKILDSTSGSYSGILKDVYPSQDSGTTTTNNDVYRENVFIGDSQVQGLLISGVVYDNNAVYGVGYGYPWLTGNGPYGGATNATNGGLNTLKSKMRDGASYNVIFWIGANDVYDVTSYYNKYYELATGEWSNNVIYVVSLGPTDDSRTAYLKNDMVDEFNSELSALIYSSGLSNLKFINLNYTFESINTYSDDGLHYGADDYRGIYNIIMNNVSNNVSNRLTLYNLKDYCTYYTLTENDAFWWPVGSNSATQGKIYGGDPASTTITSNFGLRSSGNHSGVDIGAPHETPVIAAQSGTVIVADDSGCADVFDCQGCICSQNGSSYGNHIKIDHGNGIVTVYGHLTAGSITVHEGDTVVQGQKIGGVGSSGSSTGYHLHFEVRVNGVTTNPLEYVDPNNPRPTNIHKLNVIIDPSGNMTSVCLTLSNSGFSKNAVIAIMTNMSAESGFNPENTGDNGTSYGLIQWHNSRWTKLKNYVPSSWKTLNGQLEFFFYEFEQYTSIYRYLQENHTAEDMSTQFCIQYEGPKDAENSCPIRTQNYIGPIKTFVENDCKG